MRARQWLNTGPGRETACVLVVWALILAYVLFFGVLTVLKHNAFQTTAFDLGNVDQAVWNTRHGRPLAMTNIEGLTNRLGTHVEPILLPISLLYFLWSDPRILLLLQTIVIALGAWPVYLLAKRAIGGQGSTVSDQPAALADQATADQGRAYPGRSRILFCILPIVLVFAYLMFPTLQSANVFDFHAVSLAPAFFLAALYCLVTRRWVGLAVFAVLTMSTKEDMPLLVAMLGIFALIISRGRLWRVAVLLIVVAGVWFVLAVGVIMPHFDTADVSPFANRYEWLGDGPAEMAMTLLTRPGVVAQHVLTGETLAYLRDWLAPVAFLALLAPQVLLLAVPVLAVNLLSSDGFMHELEGFHYGALLAPIAVAAAAYGVAWLTRRLPRARALPAVLAAAVLAATLIYHYGHGYTPLAAGFAQTRPEVSLHDRLGAEIAGRIPTDASLAALPYLNPHASERQQLSMIDRVENGRLEPLHDADYVWLDVTNSWPLHPNDLRAAVDELLAGEYGVAEASDGYLLLRRGEPRKELPDEFYSFARGSQDADPQYPMRLQFLLDGRPVLESLGFDLDWERDGVVATYYWRALEPLPAGLRLYPFYVDDATGEVLEDTTLRPMVASVWHPPERWRPGEVIKTSTLPYPAGPNLSLGLGVVQGGDWTAAGQRLPIHVESSGTVIRLFDGDTWARLLHVAGGRPVEEPRTFGTAPPEAPALADLGPVRLLSADVRGRRDDRWDVRLRWQGDERTQISYTVFLQLLDPQGRVRGQVDAVPQGGGYPTMWWLPGEVVDDELTIELAPDAPPGPYRLITGLYDPATGTRLMDAATGKDFVEIATMERK